MSRKSGGTRPPRSKAPKPDAPLDEKAGVSRDENGDEAKAAEKPKYDYVFAEHACDEPDEPDGILLAYDAIIRRLYRRKNADEMSQIVLSSFPSGDAALKATCLQWMQLGFSNIESFFLSNTKDIIRYIDRNGYGEHPLIKNLDNTGEFFASNFFGLTEERFLLFCINNRGTLIEQVLLNQGIDDAALFSLRSLMDHSVRLKSKGIILAHNHPGGTLRPSQEDLDCTMEVLGVAEHMGVPLLDHIIVANNQVVSIRDNGFIPEGIWLRQDPKSHLLKNWLSPSDPNVCIRTPLKLKRRMIMNYPAAAPGKPARKKKPAKNAAKMPDEQKNR